MPHVCLYGLFAARTWLEGCAAEAMVFINTLRQDSARLKWIGDALVRAVEVGGLAMIFLSQAITLWQGLAIAVICSSVFVEVAWSKFHKADA